MFLPTDWLALGAAVLGIGGLVWGVESHAWTEGRQAGARRIVHATVCLFVAATPWVFSGPGPVCLLATGFVAVNGLAWGNGWWRRLHASRPDSWGTVAVPLAVLPAAAATWGVSPDRLPSFQMAFLVVALADPLAAWVGETVATRQWMGRATSGGTGAFFLVAWGLVGGGLMVSGHPFGYAVAAGGGVAVVSAVTEAVSTRGSDNLFVVLAVILTLSPLSQLELSLVRMATALGLGGGLAVCAARWELLTRRGAGVAGLFAAALVGLGGISWAVPGIVFFSGSSALSVLPHPFDPDPSPRRTTQQVLANGGVAWGLLCVWSALPADATSGRMLCYVGFIGALAAAAADTWATELGMRWARRPWSIRTFRLVSPGTSGAVSPVGTMAGIAGAATVAGSAVVAGDIRAGAGGWMVVGGAAGMLADSLLGATVQAQYRTGTDWSETPEDQADEIRGVRGVDNNVVNLVGTLVGAGSAVAGLVFFGG